MNHLTAIAVLRDTCAHSGLDSLIEAIAADLDRYLPVMEPEERDHTRFVLERLLDLQAAAVRSATNRGGVMAQRQRAAHAERDGPANPDFFPVAQGIVNPFGRAA